MKVNATEIGLFYQKFNQIQDMDYVILSGSLPRGVTPNLLLSQIHMSFPGWRKGGCKPNRKI